MIETRLLRYFLTIAREQNITKAAEALHVTQSTLSKQMMELEDRLRKQLLIRGKRRVTLTEEGQFLRKQAQEIMELMDKTESAFLSGDSIVGGDVYLGCAETQAMSEIAAVFQSIHAEYPRVQFHIFSGDAEAVMERLDKGLLDIGILQDPAVYERFEYTRLRLKDVFGLLMPRDCALAQKKAVTLDDLEGLPLIFSQQTHHGPSRTEWFGRRYEQYRIVATYNLLYNATHLVEQGIGYAFCLDGLTDTKNRNLTFRPFVPPLEAGLVAVSKKYQPFSPAAKVFMERLKEAFL
ncbi:LysR family transcriptional regulator [Agathobaculum sp. TL06]